MANQEFTDFEVPVDLTDVPAWGGEGGDPAPAGDWQLDIVNVSNAPSSTNKPMLTLRFEIVANGDGTEAPEEARGKIAYNNYMLDNATGLGRVKQLMIAVGASMDKIRGSEFMGQRIRATIVHNQGAAKVDQNGNTQPPKIFANVTNEQPIEAPVAAQTQAATKTPPIMNKAGAAAKPANGTGARRA